MGDGNGVDFRPIIRFKTGFSESLVDDWLDGFEMGTGSDFRDHTTVICEDIDLRNYDIAQNMITIFDNGGSSFITRSFDTQNFHE